MLTALFLAVVLPTAGAARDGPLIAFASGTTRGGIRIVAAGAPGTPWAAVQLHVRLSDADLTPADRAALDSVAAALTEGALERRPRSLSHDIAELGGASRARVSADALLISTGAPAERMGELLRLFDERLRARGRLEPATKPVEPAAALDRALDPRAIALAAPGHPMALPTSIRALDARELRAAVERLLRRDRVAISVVGPLAPPELIALAARSLAASLPPPALDAAALLPLPLTSGTRLAEVEDASVRDVRSTLWIVGGGRGSDPKERAARSVLARLVGGRTEALEQAQAIVLDIAPVRPSLAARSEQERLDAIAAIAAVAPPLEAVERERAKERAERLGALKESEALASALGRALLAGDAGLVEKELQALLEVTPDDVAAAARAAASGPKLIWRTVGAAP